jgi:hypothetical protein
MREILPGVFHWTAFHEPIGARVSSHYVQSAGIVIDPKVPEEGIDALPGEPRLMHDDGTLRFVSDKLLGEDPERVKRELRQAFRDLLELDFDNLLFAHSEPLIGGGKNALSDFVEN